MDCARCQERLTELALGLLSPEETRRVEAHLVSCASCAAEAERLREGARFASMLELEEPAPRVSAAILTAARESARERAGAKRAAARVAEHAPTAWDRITAWFRESATSPQGAMGTLTLLLVAIGIFYLPSHRPLMNAEGGTLAPAASESEATGAAPAPPIPALPPLGSSNSARSSAPSAQPVVVAPKPESAPASELDLDALSDDLLAGDKPGAVAGRAAPSDRLDERADAEHEPSARSRDEVSEGASSGSSAGAGAGSLEVAQRRTTVASSAPATVAPASAPVAPSPTQAVSASRGGVASAPPAPPLTARPQAQAEESVARSSARAPAEPARIEAAADGSEVDLLAAARADRSRGACAAATTEYERWLSHTPSSPQRGAAMIELADCLRRTGRTLAARQWLQRASETPAVAAVARRELERLDAADAAPAAASSSQGPSTTTPAAAAPSNTY